MKKVAFKNEGIDLVGDIHTSHADASKRLAAAIIGPMT